MTETRPKRLKNASHADRLKSQPSRKLGESILYKYESLYAIVLSVELIVRQTRLLTDGERVIVCEL